MKIDEHYLLNVDFDLEKCIQAGDINGAQHLIRYIWSEKVIADYPQIKTILDIACGSGYGSDRLASRFPQVRVLGVDYDPLAIEQAKGKYSRPNLSFQQGNALLWEKTIGKEVYDCIISFDTIEHIPHREIFMENLVKHLHPMGLLLLSTPCGWMETVLEPEFIYHKIEYSASSLYDFLWRYFQVIQRPDDNSLPHAEVFDQLLARNVDYLLRMNPVICSIPILINNPYRNQTVSMAISRQRRLKGWAVWRQQGLLTLLKKGFRHLKHRITAAFQK